MKNKVSILAWIRQKGMNACVFILNASLEFESTGVFINLAFVMKFL